MSKTTIDVPVAEDSSGKPIKKESRPSEHPSTGSRAQKKVPKKNKVYEATGNRQRTLKEVFPVRRSTRKCKAIIESEMKEKNEEKLRLKIEEGLKVVEVEGKGRGVVCTRPFFKGELICEYSGVLLREKEAEKKEEEYLLDPGIGCYMYFFNYKSCRLCVDATEDNGRLGRLVNHSKSHPNVRTKIIEVDSRPYLCLMADKDISVGEELQYDYGERRGEVIKELPWLAS